MYALYGVYSLRWHISSLYVLMSEPTSCHLQSQAFQDRTLTTTFFESFFFGCYVFVSKMIWGQAHLKIITLKTG